MNGAANSRISPTAAEVAAHCVVDVAVGRVCFLRQQAGRRHHLSRLAVTALRDLYFQPGSLHRVAHIARKAFDRSHILTRGASDRSDARTDPVSVVVHTHT